MSSGHFLWASTSFVLVFLVAFLLQILLYSPISPDPLHLPDLSSADFAPNNILQVCKQITHAPSYPNKKRKKNHIRTHMFPVFVEFIYLSICIGYDYIIKVKRDAFIYISERVLFFTRSYCSFILFSR